MVKISDDTVLRHTSLDGFLFLRYLKVLGIICSVGLCLTWPILLPLHGTGGAGLTQLDLLTIGNVVDQSRFYAHVVVAWIFFGKPARVPLAAAVWLTVNRVRDVHDQP